MIPDVTRLAVPVVRYDGCPWGAAPTPEDIEAARALALEILAELATDPAKTAVAGHLDPGFGGGDSPFTPDREWHTERDGDL